MEQIRSFPYKYMDNLSGAQETAIFQKSYDEVDTLTLHVDAAAAVSIQLLAGLNNTGDKAKFKAIQGVSVSDKSVVPSTIVAAGIYQFDVTNLPFYYIKMTSGSNVTIWGAMS